MCLYIHNSIIYFKKRTDLSINDSDTESLCIEIIDTRSKNIIVSTIYRSPSGKIKAFKTHLKDLITKNQKTGKLLYLIGDFNLNVLDYETNTKVKNFLNFLFQHSLIPMINKPTRITKRTATATDHITNSFVSPSVTTGIIKSGLSDHLPIFITCNKQNLDVYSKKTTIFKRYFNDKSINYFTAF